MARDGFRVRAPLLLPDDVDVATTGMESARPQTGGALRYVLDPSRAIADQAAAERAAAQLGSYDAGLVGPPDLRDAPSVVNAASERAYNAAFNREHERQRSRSMRRALALGRNLRSSYSDATGNDPLPIFGDYAPGVLGLRFLDVPSLGLADEAIGGLAAAIDPDLDYADAQRAVEENVALGAEEHPWSARIGTLAGVLPALPLSEVLLGSGGTSGAARVANAASRPALGGAVLGGVGGAARAEPGHRLEGAVEGAATGYALGATGGALGGGARVLRALPDPGTGIAAGALEGAGFGALATPGTSSHTVLEPGDLAAELPENMLVGAGLGTGLSALASTAELAGQLGRGRALIPGGRAPEPISAGTGEIDEAALDLAGLLPDEVSEGAARAALGPSPADVVANSRAERARVPWLARLFRESIEADPVTQRMLSLGLTDQRQLRQAANAFGGLDRTLAAANEVGLGLPGTQYSTRSAVADAATLRESVSRDLATLNAEVASAGRVIPGGELADRIEAIAQRYERPLASPRERAIAQSLRARADDFRYGSIASGGERPTTSYEDLIDEETGEVLSEPVTTLPDELAVDYPELRRSMAAQAYENRQTYSGSRTGAISPEEEAGLDVYRALQGARNDEIRAVLGDERYGGEYVPRNRAFRIADLIAGDPQNPRRIETRQPAMFRGALGGMADSAGGQPGGRITGFLREKLIGEYQPSVIATLNEIGMASPEQALQSSARAMLRSGAPMDDATRSTIETFALRAPRGDEGQLLRDALERAAVSGRSAGGDAALNANRAMGLATAADQWPLLVRRLEQLSRVAPEQAEALATRVRGLGPAGASGLLEHLADVERRGQAQEHERATPEAQARETAEHETYVRERNAGLLQSLVPSPEPSPDEPTDPDVDRDYVDERNDRLRNSLTRGRPDASR